MFLKQRVFEILVAGVFLNQCFWLLGSEFTNSNSPEFLILIASYNNKEYAFENLMSACFQESSRPYEVIYVNDCSTDNTGEIVEKFIRENNLEKKVRVIHNKVNIGPLENYYNIIHSFIPDHKIVVNLDGDDLFPHNQVLITLEKYYQDSNLWLTWGSALQYPVKKGVNWCGPLSNATINSGQFRKVTVCNHLRTFKAGLFKQIEKKDLLYNGKFMRVSGDLAFMLPMIEMAAPAYEGGKPRFRFVPEILYYYRTTNPISDFRIFRNEQLSVDAYIRNLKPYKPLGQLMLGAPKK